MSIFDEIVARIPNKLTIDELIEIYNSGIVLAGFGDVVGPLYGAEFPSFEVSRYLCNAVVMYYTMQYFHEKTGIVLDVLKEQIASEDDTAFSVLQDLDMFLDEVCCEMYAARRKVEVRYTTVVEQLLAGAGIDYQSRISADDPDSITVLPILGDSTPESVIAYGVDAVLDCDYDGITGDGDFGTRVWLLNRIKERNPNFVLNFTWY